MRLRYYPEADRSAAPHSPVQEKDFAKDYYIDDELYEVVARHVKLETYRELQDAAKKIGGQLEMYVVDFIDYQRSKFLYHKNLDNP